jgi:hypothetical protein
VVNSTARRNIRLGARSCLTYPPILEVERSRVENRRILGRYSMMKQVYNEASVIFSLIINMDGFDAFIGRIWCPA